MAQVTSPLILTLTLDEASFARFDRERQAHFPAHLNHLSAHVTLFHHLPGDEHDAITAELHAACRNQPHLPVRATSVRSLGRGVAYRLESPELTAFRARLARTWEHWLTPQDRQRFQPHVTVQNKVTPDEARALHEQLQQTFVPFAVRGEGVSLWRYLRGPWELAETFAFRCADLTG